MRAGDVAADGEPCRAVPHAWLELEGRVLDICTDGLALCEAARRASVDYSDAGRDARALGPPTRCDWGATRRTRGRR